MNNHKANADGRLSRECVNDGPLGVLHDDGLVVPGSGAVLDYLLDQL